ncbi:MAG: DUF3006 domain-containing protein [Oscillospiraceae bacterium]|nr:DUF3006 domain-containing protein [Oscillospiraceae bacterium]
MTYWIIDRMDEGWAVCEKEDGGMARLEVAALPLDVREGDCLFLGGDGRWQIDQEETCRRRQETASRLRALFQKSEDPPEE